MSFTKFADFWEVDFPLSSAFSAGDFVSFAKEVPFDCVDCATDLTFCARDLPADIAESAVDCAFDLTLLTAEVPLDRTFAAADLALWVTDLAPLSTVDFALLKVAFIMQAR
jgi:hypothetical protein